MRNRSKTIQQIIVWFVAGMLIAFAFVPTAPRIAQLSSALIQPSVAEPEPTPAPSKMFPLKIAPSKARVTSEFGPRQSFRTSTGWASSNHKGIDLACAEGDPLVAVEGGTTEYIDSDLDGWGITISIHTHGGDKFLYAHTSDRLAPNHSLVKAGDVIAECGATGSATNTHLHLEYLPGGGSAINPRPYLEALGLPKT